MGEIIKKEEAEIISAYDDTIEEGPMIITFKKPYLYEGKEYTRLDLTGLENIRTHDMIDVNRAVSRGGNTDFIQELSLEYAIHLAQRATGLPFEFFDLMPAWAAMKVKYCVMGFLNRQG